MDGEGPCLVGVHHSIPNTSPYPDPTNPPIPLPTHIMCDYCQEVLPLADFPNFNPKRGCKNLCNVCESAILVNKIAQREKDVLVTSLASLAMKGKSATQKDIPELGEICAAMIERFGGLDSFCELWHQQIIAAMTNKPGGKTGLDSMKSLANMAGETQKLETQRRAIDRLTPEEISDEIEMRLKRLSIGGQQKIEGPPEEKKVG